MYRKYLFIIKTLKKISISSHNPFKEARSIRISDPSFLHHQSLCECVTYGLEEKTSLTLAFDVC
jgi:hypothetical protein